MKDKRLSKIRSKRTRGSRKNKAVLDTKEDEYADLALFTVHLRKHIFEDGPNIKCPESFPVPFSHYGLWDNIDDLKICEEILNSNT